MTLDLDYLSLELGPKPDLLRVTWHGAVSLAELQHGYAHVQAAAQRFQAGRWFVDSRYRPLPLPPEQAHWLHHEFLPAVFPLFAEPLRLACLLTPAQLEALWQDPERSAKARALTDPDRPFWLSFFDNERTAWQWLQAE